MDEYTIKQHRTIGTNMSSVSHSFKLVDGYALDATDGYSYTTNWVDVHDAPGFSVSTVFTGGSPSGTLTLQQSNDRQWTGKGIVQPLLAVSANNSSGAVKIVSDAVNVPSGTGQASAAVSGAGVYVLNQVLAPYHWVRLVYTASVGVATQLDVFMHLKK